ncbi:MAG: A/G-specific adenine glycosylase [Clostridia bacterium]|nr:A/G-specific adenine glycosylase [Clostridia bacterium]
MKEIKQAIPALLQWYRQTARPLPWRQNPTPYGVWVSEIMLQQTRIEAVIPYYHRFMAELPTVAALAAVEDDRLMKLWEGLGYYSRARNLKKAAETIMAHHGGELPADHKALLALPGFGPYTAGAVASIAFGIPAPAVDGNVMRVLARLLADFEDVMRPATKRRYTELLEAWISTDAPGDFNSALMELGERVCLPNTTPKCEECPLYAVCKGREQGVAALLPVRAAKKQRRVEERVMLLLISSEDTPRVLLHRRPATGLLAGLWELPNLEGPYDFDKACAAAESLGATVLNSRLAGEGVHLFSHVEWRMTGVQITTSPFTPPDGYQWVSLAQLHEDYALPTAFRPFARLLPVLMERRVTDE